MKRAISYLLLILSFLFWRNLLMAQCIPISASDFMLPPTACPDEPLNFTNPDARVGVNYEWDFCTEDMQTSPQISLFSALFGSSGLLDTKIVEDNGEYFMFVTSYNNSSLFRIDLGDSPDNPPQAITNLGNPSNALNKPVVLDIIKEEATGNWYAFVYQTDTNDAFIRISFGNSLKNTPNAQLAGTLTNGLFGFKFLKEGANYYLITNDYFTKTLMVVDVGNSLANNFSMSDVITSMVIPEQSTWGTCSADYIWDCGTLNVIFSDKTKNFHVKFLGSITNAPTYSFVSLPTGYDNNYATKIMYEDGTYYVLNASFNSGKLCLSNYGNSISSNTPTSSVIGTLPATNQTRGLTGVYAASAYYFFNVNFSTNQIFKIKFKRNCEVNTNLSTDINPTNIRYRKTGIQPTVLRVKDSATDEVLEIYTDSANINTTTTVANFTADSVCVGTPITFANTSVGSDAYVSSWLWDFGDGNSSTLKTPTHTYASAGTYNVTLTVNNLNTCNNSITKTIVASAGVTANFQDIPLACVGQSITFNNLSTYTNLPFDEATGFYWNFGDGTYSPYQNPSKTYNTAGIYTITLTAKDQAGCIDVISKNIEILDNPTVSFNIPTNICVGQSVQFVSNATNATEYLWLFEGNGTSTEMNPTVTFNQAGLYDVTLQVKNANNCINTFVVENIEVLEAPSIIFTRTKNAQNPLEITFNNLTTGASSYEWNFGDGATSLEGNPTHIYTQSGEYEVLLKAISPNNCEATISQIIGVGTLKTDVSLQELNKNENTLSVFLKNNGNTLLNNLQIEVQIGDTTLLEVYPNTMKIGEEVTYTLQNSLPQELVQKNAYFCVKVLPKTSLEDTNLADNQLCMNLSNRLLVFEPYPNPTEDLLTFSFTAPNDGEFQITFTDLAGKKVSFGRLLSRGFNQETISMKNFAKGIYLLSFEFGDKIYHKKIVKL
ncbi:MAG: PKD domain-containing protein [Thermonemataceae bacterium]|nr:PKD domain-containing protein [Thermonemataceae bacterium]